MWGLRMLIPPALGLPPYAAPRVPFRAMAKKATKKNKEQIEVKSKPNVEVLVTEGVGPVPPCLRLTSSGAVSIAVQAKPGSKQASVSNVGGDSVGIAIDAPPREGEANDALLEYLAEVLGLKKRQVFLQCGGKSRVKVVVAEGCSIHDVHRALVSAQKEKDKD